MDTAFLVAENRLLPREIGDFSYKTTAFLGFLPPKTGKKLKNSVFLKIFVAFLKQRC